MEQIKPILMKLAQYGELIMTGMAIMFGGMFAMILVLTVVLAAERLGYSVTGLAGIAILLVLVGATLFFFLIPFLPRLPFVSGNIIEVRGVMDTVGAIATTFEQEAGISLALPQIALHNEPHA